MADTRINALSTATVSLSDDFLPIDGTTAGTRKLSAYSPTFGGNATVGGTLTVSGTGNSTFGGNVIARRDHAGITALTVDNQNTGGTTNLFLTEDAASTNYFRIYRSGSTTGTPNVVNISNIVGGSASTTAIEFGSPVKALSTTASTSTSSGALVVGNGTSGGLGVGGNVTSLGFLLAGNGASKNANTDAGFYSTATGNTTLHVAGFTGGSQSADILKVSLNGISEWLAVKASGQVACYATTASTSTSSGALVVSGGVGVAGDVYAGGTTGFKLGSSSGAYRFSAGAFIDAESSSVVRLLDSSANFATVKTGSLIALTPATAPSLTVNSTMTFELTSNTTLKVFVRGTDGTTRSVSLTLA
jgi:hypothetical protein